LPDGSKAKVQQHFVPLFCRNSISACSESKSKIKLVENEKSGMDVKKRMN